MLQMLKIYETYLKNKIKITFQVNISRIKILLCNALSIYRSQTILCLFEPGKNLTAFSAASKAFVPAQKSILLNANHLFDWHKMFVTASKSKYDFGLAQKICTSPKHFETCKGQIISKRFLISCKNE